MSLDLTFVHKFTFRDFLTFYLFKRKQKTFFLFTSSLASRLTSFPQSTSLRFPFLREDFLPAFLSISLWSNHRGRMHDKEWSSERTQELQTELKILVTTQAYVVQNSRRRYYSILEPFCQRSQHMIIKFPLS